MALINQTQDATKLLCWGRGDSSARGFKVVDALGVAVDITGRTYLLTANTEEDPAPGTELFSVTGVITDAAAGLVAFAPTTTDTNVTSPPLDFFYDIQETDTGGLVSTLIKAKGLILQDITK